MNCIHCNRHWLYRVVLLYKSYAFEIHYPSYILSLCMVPEPGPGPTAKALAVNVGEGVRPPKPKHLEKYGR